MSKSGSFSSNFLVLFSGSAISQVVPILFAPIITRLFPDPAQMAIHGNFIALAGMIAIIAGGRYETAIVLPAEKKKAMNLLTLATWITLIVTLISILFYFFRDQVAAFYNDNELSGYLILLLVAVPLYSMTAIFTQWLIREKKYRALSSSKIAQSTFIGLFTVLFGYASYGVLGLILGTLIGLFISLLMMFISSKSSLDYSLVNGHEMKSMSKEYKDFPLINAPHAFADLLLGQFILFAVITREFGLVELGLFFIMMKYLSASMKAVGGSVGQLYYREASDRFSNNEDISRTLFRSVKLVAIFAVPACLIILFFGPQIFGWFLGPNYARSGEYAQIMIVPMLINFLTSPISATPIIYRKQGLAFVFSLIGYSTGIVAILIGNYFDFDFYHTLMFFAATQSLYYLWLLLWYIHLTRRRS